MKNTHIKIVVVLFFISILNSIGHAGYGENPVSSVECALVLYDQGKTLDWSDPKLVPLDHSMLTITVGNFKAEAQLKPVCAMDGGPCNVSDVLSLRLIAGKNSSSTSMQNEISPELSMTAKGIQASLKCLPSKGQ